MIIKHRPFQGDRAEQLRWMVIFLDPFSSHSFLTHFLFSHLKIFLLERIFFHILENKRKNQMNRPIIHSDAIVGHI